MVVNVVKRAEPKEKGVNIILIILKPYDKRGSVCDIFVAILLYNLTKEYL